MGDDSHQDADDAPTAPSGPVPLGTRLAAGIVTALLVLSTVLVGAVPVGAQGIVSGVALGLLIALWLPSTRLKLRLAFCVALLAAALTATDLLLRVVVGPRLHARPDYAFAERHPAVPARRLCPGAEVTMPVAGDLAAITADPSHREVREVAFAVDAFGYRNAGHLAEQPCDVILLGDSFGLGSGVTQDATWASQLAQRSGKRVYNLSPPSGGPWHEVATLAAELPRIERAPGAVLVWSIFTGNDLGDAYLEPLPAGTVPPPGPLARLGTWHHNVGLRSPVRHVLRMLAGGSTAAETVRVGADAGGRPVLFLDRYLTAGGHDLAHVRDHPNAGALASTFDDLAALAAAAGLRVLVVSIPTKGEVYRELVPPDVAPIPAGRSGVAQFVETLATERAMGFVDLRPALEDAAAAALQRDGSLLWWRDDTHWNDAGHAVATDAVLRALE